uniref:Dopamine beta-hydroxylase n=1 Tax=Fundulus heteroclitus TaxID=8078 RepID=A0A3Q2QMA9_FUNHE
MKLFNKDLRLQDITIMYFTGLAALMVILVASYQAPSNAVDVSSLKPSPSSPLLPLPMPFRMPLDPRGDLLLAWNISYASQEVYMQLRVAEVRHGVVLGMSDRGELTNADLVVLWDAGTKSYFGDAWSDSEGRVSLDSQQDYELIEAKQKADGFYLLFKRPFSTCDPRDYVIEAFYYPPDAGLAIGGPGSSRFLRLEVHYHNPLLISTEQYAQVHWDDFAGEVLNTLYNTAPISMHCNQSTARLFPRHDSSGIRLHYTPSLRRYDAGIMELGLVYTPIMAIPPKQHTFYLTGYCTSKCTRTALPPGGIYVFASQLHTHLAGRGVKTVLVRGGKELEVVQEDQHFSTDYQEGTVHIIYGLLDQPLASLEDLNLSRIHTGVQRILMLRPDTPSPTLPPDVQTLDVLAPNAIIPNQETTYWCFIQKLPDDMTKNHIVMYESVITPGNEAIVHHIEVFECAPDLREVPQYSGSCDDKMKPKNINFCRHVLAAWAMGAEGGFGIMEEMCVNYIHYYPRTQLELCKSHVDPGYLQKYFNFIN